MTVEAIARMLGDPRVLKQNIGTSTQLVALTREGLPTEILTELAQALSMDRKSVAQAVGITGRTLSRRLSPQARLSSEESDRTVRLARILALATETFGDQTKASRWLQTANRVLQGHTPFELLDTDAGVQSVETVLGGSRTARIANAGVAAVQGQVCRNSVSRRGCPPVLGSMEPFRDPHGLHLNPHLRWHPLEFFVHLDP